MSAATAPAAASRARVFADALAGVRAGWGVAHWRHGWCGSVALAILACAASVELAKNRPLRAELSALSLGASGSRRVVAPLAPTLARSDVATRARQIEAMLLGQAAFESQYQQLIEIAARHRIELPRAEYVTTVDEPGGMVRVQVSLTVATRYPQFRSFIEEVLRTLPAASLDQFSVRREHVAQAQVEVLVRMSFWAVRSLATSAPMSGLADRSAFKPGPTQPPLPLDLPIDRARLYPPAQPRQPRDLFAVVSWLPAPTAPAPAPSRPAEPGPTLPTLTVLGKKHEAQQWEVYLAHGERTLIAREGATIDDGWRVERIAPPTMTLTMVATGQTMTIDVGEAR